MHYHDLCQNAVILRLNIHLRLVRFDLEQNIAGRERLSCVTSDVVPLICIRRRAIVPYAPRCPCRTFFDLPARDVAFGHGGRERGHLEVLRGGTRGRGAEACGQCISG